MFSDQKKSARLARNDRKRKLHSRTVFLLATVEGVGVVFCYMWSRHSTAHQRMCWRFYSHVPQWRLSNRAHVLQQRSMWSLERVVRVGHLQQIMRWAF